MSKEEKLFRYYATQRHMEPSSVPALPDNPMVSFQNFDERRPVEGGAFSAWGVLTYEKPLSDEVRYRYELRPSRVNPDVRETMYRQAQTIGPWEVYRHVPEEKRVTEYDPETGRYRPKEGITPERMTSQQNSAQKFPVSRKWSGRGEKPPHR